jgi:hypothetical protein
LTGEVTNWSQLGWQDLPIKIVLVQTGGGVQASIEAQLGIKISVKDPIRVQISSQVNKIVEQEPAAFGLGTDRKPAAAQCGRANDRSCDRTAAQHGDIGRTATGGPVRY